MNSDLKAGSKVGKYILDAYLGGGSFGAVWRCHDETTGAPAAIKLLTGALSSSETAAMRAEVEMLAAFAASRSEHVVHILGGGPEPVPHVVMEYIEGSDFQTLLKDQEALSAERTIESGIAIADALRVLNEAGIIHRDIKPANVMVDKQGVIKLTDFGIAKIVGYETMTMTGQAAMTMAYAAPEIWDDSSAFGRPSHKSDLYAMGVLLYQCLTGATPFRGNYGALYKAHTERPPDISALPATTPPSLRAVIRGCLQKRQEDRPTGAEACLLMLQRAQVELIERGGVIPAHEPTAFGPWQRGAIHETAPWAWHCCHESSGEEATVEVHFAESVDYSASLRKAVAVNSKLAPLGAERLIETNRLLQRPEESWQAAPPGRFQFWVAREDRAVTPAASVTLPILASVVGSLATLLDAAAGEDVTPALRDNLTVLDSGGIYLRRPILDTTAANPELDALEIIRGLPLDPEAAGFVASAISFRALAQTFEARPDNATVVINRADQTVVVGRDDGTVVVGRDDGTVVIDPNQPFVAEAPTPVAAPIATAAAAAPAAAPVAAALASLAAVRLDLRRTSARSAVSEYELSLQNQGQAPIELSLAAHDTDDALAFSLPGHVTVREGSSERVRLRVEPLKRRLFGGKRSWRFTVSVSGGGNGEPPLTVEGEFDEEPSRLPLLAGAGVLGVAVLAIFGAVALAGGGGKKSETPAPLVAAAQTETPTPTPTMTPVPTVELPPPPPPPVQDQPAAQAPVVAPPVQPQPTARPPTATPVPAVIPPPPPPVAPPAPTIALVPDRPPKPVIQTLGCTSSQTTTAPNNGGSLNAYANEMINCKAVVSGAYTALEWGGGSLNGTGLTFQVSFGARGTGSVPYNITFRVTWAGGVETASNAVYVSAGGGNCTTTTDGGTACIGSR